MTRLQPKTSCPLRPAQEGPDEDIEDSDDDTDDDDRFEELAEARSSLHEDPEVRVSVDPDR